MSPWWKRPTEEALEEEPAAPSAAVQSSEVIEPTADDGSDLETAARDESREEEETEEAHVRAADAAAPPTERAGAEGERALLRLEDDGGGPALPDQADTGAPEAADDEDLTSEDAALVAEAPAPKPRRRRSSRGRRGSGAGAAAAANGGSVAGSAPVEGEAQVRPAPQAAPPPPRREIAAREAGGRDAAARDAGPRDAGREAGPREAGRDGGGRDGGGRESGGRDGGGRRDGADRQRSPSRADLAPDHGARAPLSRPATPWSTPQPQPTTPEGAALVTAREVAHQIAEALRDALGATPENTGDDVDRERKIALFCDLENIAIGVRDSEIKKFDIDLVLERLLEKGKIIVKKAYADWQRYTEFKKPLHTAGIELIDIPQKYYSGKNSADIKMVVDAMDLCYSKEHLDTFVLLSGDSDFTPLVSKLKENNKHVIGVGVKSSSSKLLIDNCDEFIYYEDIWRDSLQAPVLEGIDEKKAEAFALMNDSIAALIRENKSVLWGSMVKQTMQRKRPSFNEGYYGYGSFSDLLEDAERKKVIHLKKDARSGSYVVTGFARVK